MGIELGLELIKTVIQDTYIFNISWIISAVLTMLTLLIITKDYNKWKTLAFPVMVGWHISGVTPFILLYMFGAIMFAIESLSVQVISGLLSATTKVFKENTEKIRQKQKEYVRKNKRSQMTEGWSETLGKSQYWQTMNDKWGRGEIPIKELEEYIKKTSGNKK